MKWYYIALIVAVLAVAFFLGYFSNKIVLTGKAVEELENISKNYSWTTAICNSNRECIDVHVKCEGGKVVSMEPVSKLIEFSESWIDQREEIKFCE
ncbi:MAG: hypothetical protein AABW65_00220 [Nanoarchaeota archaeon]